MRIAYHPESEAIAKTLSEMGYELFPFDAITPCDAVLYSGDTLPACVPGKRGALLLNTSGKAARQLAVMLEQNSYEPIVPLK